MISTLSNATDYLATASTHLSAASANASSHIAYLAQETAGNGSGTGLESLALISLVGFVLLGFALVILIIAALVSVVRSHNYTSAGKAIWVLAIFAFPVIGALVWFIWGRNSSFNSL